MKNHFRCLAPIVLTFFTVLILSASLIANAGPTDRAPDQEPGALPAGVVQTLSLLVDAAQDKQSSVSHDSLSALLEFTANTALTRDDWEVEGLHGATGAYYGYRIGTPVEKIVARLYHPGLPPSLFHPSVVRTGTWKREPVENIPEIWSALQDDQTVFAVRGMEREENTPDVNTGGYYTYETDRLILMLSHHGEKYLVSVSKQTDKSTVGHKGVVLGEDSEWNYYYLDEQGLTLGGLGWVNSYIFDSFSVTVLSACPDHPGQSRHVMFKWVRAGWSGLNMVRTGHVRDGCIRFAQSLTRLMESDQLPDIKTIAAMVDHVQAMDQDQLERALSSYVKGLQSLSEVDPVLSRRAFRSVLQDDPLEHYSLEARQSLVMKEFLKESIGMPTLLTLPEDLRHPYATLASHGR